MAEDLRQYGISGITSIRHNPSYDELFELETDPKLDDKERGKITDLGAVAIDTGIFTGRSPKDKYIVREASSEQNIWWAPTTGKGSDNKPITAAVWDSLLQTASNQLSAKPLFVLDVFCGANANTRLNVRIITEIAWQAHFVKNMFIEPTVEELQNFKPDFVLLNACRATNPHWQEQGLNSEVFVAFHLQKRMAVIGGTWYGGEIKKGIFSVMNYFLPLRGIASMHCSANMGKDGDTAIFFGLSGTGKTTLSADPNRLLIGDDEHGWDDEGVFNLEGGCYAKCINLDAEKEPDIYRAIRKNALLENVDFDPHTGKIDFSSTRKTENTRVSYPIDHIANIVRPVSKGGHPKNVIFLTADAFGVLPPVAKLTREQAMYYFLSGYTAKVAGTERGIKEPMPAFSSAFGVPFLLLHPTKYADELVKKMDEHGSKAWLVNTGWVGGAYGVGKRIDIVSTRRIIDAILSGDLENAECTTMPVFGLLVPKSIPGVDAKILDPRALWSDGEAYDRQRDVLAERFIANFVRFTDNEQGKRLVDAGPKLG